MVAGIALNFAAEAAALLGYNGSAYENFSTKAAELLVPFSQQAPGELRAFAEIHRSVAEFETMTSVEIVCSVCRPS